MSRTTHPVDTHQHSRAHVRSELRRYATKRWRQEKDATLNVGADGRFVIDLASPKLIDRFSRVQLAELAAALQQEGPVVFCHPEQLRRLPRRTRRLAGAILGVRIRVFGELAEHHRPGSEPLPEINARRRLELDRRAWRAAVEQ